MDFLKMAQDIKDDMIENRRHFHMNPELSYDVFKTSEYIKKYLHSLNIEFKETAGTGICALIKGNGLKTVGIRADMDALPINEKNECAYRSKIDGKMHACGHDAHMAMLMGAARILNSIKDKLNGNVKLFFEPAEETTGGAKLMIKDGVLEDPHVDAVIGLHVESDIECGKIGIKKGVVNAASNPFNIKIYGSSGHGAHPDLCVDPVVIAASVIMNLQTVVSREISPVSPSVLTIGSIHGGTAENIIPDEVTISGIIRTMKKEEREYVKKRLVQITEGIVSSMRGKCSIDIQESYPCLYNNDDIINIIEKSSDNIIGKDNVEILDVPSMGVESFAYFSMERPSGFYYLGCGNKKKGITNPAHNSRFDIDEDCLPIGAAVHCEAVYNLLNKNK